jgi:hypothetical protein
MDKVALRQVLSKYLRFSRVSFIAPLRGKGQKIIIIVIFITGLHKKRKDGACVQCSVLVDTQ